MSYHLPVHIWLYVVGSLLGSGLGHCSCSVIWPILWAAVEFYWSHSVFHHSYNSAGRPVFSNIPRMVPCPARSRSVVWEPSSWLCNVYCGTDCCHEADGGRRSDVDVSIWKTAQTASSTRSACRLHCAAGVGCCRRTISDTVLLGCHRVLGVPAILSSTHRQQARWYGRQLLIRHVSSFFLFTSGNLNWWWVCARFIHTVQSLVNSLTSLISVLCVHRSCFTLFVHVSLCLSLLLLPIM